MKTINKIMVAVDFSDYSLPSVIYASNLAKDVAASLLLTNVFNQRDIDKVDRAVRRYPAFTLKEYVDENLADRRERLEALAKKIDAGNLEVDLNVRIGFPYEALIKEIEEKKPNLLVMGIKGRSNIMDVMTGSCADRMFRRSPIPLLTIREKESERS
jgi:nucleotide-binding universal stress UspA family protein